MNSLQNVVSENIRQNWNNYQEHLQIDSYDYNIIWDDWYKKHNINYEDVFVTVLRNFLENKNVENKKPIFDRIYITQQDEKTIIIKGLTGEERKNIHLLCDKIGLHHESKFHAKKRNKKNLYVYKPNIWLWEYTEKNPYSKGEEYYRNREIEREYKMNKKRERLSRKYCCICDKTGLETDLFCSVYIRGLYCNECLETMSDGDGGLLCHHKFEPIYI